MKKAAESSTEPWSRRDHDAKNDALLAAQGALTLQI
jgi:hypothetical protein